MATIQIKGRPDSLNMKARTVLVELARHWGDDWTVNPECEPGDLILHGASKGAERFTFKRKYGKLRFPHESPRVGIHAVSPWSDDDLNGAWVRVSWMEDANWIRELSGGTQTVGSVSNGLVRYVSFIGQVQTPSAALQGGGLGDPAGEQLYVAYGAADFLRRIPLNTSMVENPKGPDYDPVVINWVMRPNFDSAGDPVKNMSEKKAPNENGEPTYIFGKDDNWSVADYCEYLGRLINKPKNPPFRFEIESDLKEYLTNGIVNIEIEPAENILSILSKLFPPKLGMDFMVRPYNGELNGSSFSGLAIRVFSLAGAAGKWEGVTFPKYQTELAFNLSNTHSLAGPVSISDNRENSFRHFRIIGNRIKVACTFSLGENHGPLFPKLVPAWDPTDEKEYNEALYTFDNLPDKYPDGKEIMSNDPAILRKEQERVAAELNDIFRKDSRFRDVYTLFTVKDDFNPAEFWASPEFDSKGKFITSQSDQYQTLERSTLELLPVPPPSDGSDSVAKPEVDAWVYSTTLYFGDNDSLEFLGIVRPISDDGVSVEVLKDKIGIRLNVDPNHLLATSHFNEYSYPTLVRPKHYPRYQHLIVTLAWESDFRIALAYEDESANSELGTLAIEDKNSELWYYAPNVFLGNIGDIDDKMLPRLTLDYIYNDNVNDVNGAGMPIRFQNTDFDEKKQIGRNDIELLKSQMAALIARHSRRTRVIMPLLGEWPIAHLIGTGISSYQDSAYEHHPNAVVTSIQFTFGGGRTTTIFAG